MRSVRRGTLRQLVRRDGAPVEATVYGCVVLKAPHVRDGKTYVWLDLGAAAGAVDVVREACETARRESGASFSPLAGDALIAKLSRTRYADARGYECAPFQPAEGDRVDAVLRPGAFGAFGMCVLVARLKPHATAAHAAP